MLPAEPPATRMESAPIGLYLSPAQQPADRLHERVHVEGLGQELGRLCSGRSGSRAAVAGDDLNRYIDALSAQPLDEVGAVHVREREIKDDHVRLPRVDRFQ